MNVGRRFLQWMVRPQISLWDRIAIFVAFAGGLLLCGVMLAPVFDGVSLIQRVHGHGTDATAHVERSSTSSDWWEMTYDGHTKSVRREFPPDARPAVTYLPAEPHVVAFGRSGDGLFSLYMANVGVVESLKFLMGIAFAIVCLLCVFASLAPAGQKRLNAPR